ncbi:sulfotransferase family 2 domain-containing protein [Aquibaculum arenosum]|uniref:Sulfotransferase family 2 domain-containing protein n=1 Tax=Aquibaculum arenosum TaxID=3032591 RepID=A0ABT5YMF6_9PROT|nr:sulfotransferase family 2 domain-containing protein [Fodinicurvata sp. CAU 1616]MDF2096148.1 sulfotransferase family 2 domain-containing protein [Fodinicurvata sp. CAU 1616]
MRIVDIEKGFREVLGREPDPDAAAFYAQKSLTYTEFCDVLRKSREFKNKQHVADPHLVGPVHNNKFTSWPFPQLFVATNIKVLYVPIAKNACSSLKRLMVSLSDIPDKDRIATKGDIHTQTDKHNTGIQLKDLPQVEAENSLQSNIYFRFAVLRDPSSRLLSAYWEKFVINRLDPDNLNHTLPVIEQIYRSKEQRGPDPDRGVTFGEFIHFILGSDPHDLDPHWCPQSEYVKNINITEFYNVTNLSPLYHKLERVSKKSIPDVKRNVTNSGRGLSVSGASTMRPKELLQLGDIDLPSFYQESFYERVRHYYREDYRLFSLCN